MVAGGFLSGRLAGQPNNSLLGSGEAGAFAERHGYSDKCVRVREWLLERGRRKLQIRGNAECTSPEKSDAAREGRSMRM
jgi:hypothetical protein